jgi:hypothetical protein
MGRDGPQQGQTQETNQAGPFTCLHLPVACSGTWSPLRYHLLICHSSGGQALAVPTLQRCQIMHVNPCRGMAIGAAPPVASIAATQKVVPDAAVEGLEPAKLWAFFSKVRWDPV